MAATTVAIEEPKTFFSKEEDNSCNSGNLLSSSHSEHQELSPIEQLDDSSLKSKKKYTLITNEDREALIDLVLKKKIKIRDAAKQCNLKFSTSKAILATYRKEGRVGKKKTRARKTKVINTIIVAEVNPFDPTQTKIIPMMTVSETKMLPGNSHKESNKDADTMSRQDAIGAFEGLTASSKHGNVSLKPPASPLMTDSMKSMLEMAACSSKVNLLNEVQGIISKLNMATGNQNMQLSFLNNTLMSMNFAHKKTLESLLCRPKPTLMSPLTQLPTVTAPLNSAFNAAFNGALGPVPISGQTIPKPIATAAFPVSLPTVSHFNLAPAPFAYQYRQSMC